jgi:hypothetical protein
MDGQGYLGVASTMPGYTQEDRDAANAMRDRLVQSDPGVMATSPDYASGLKNAVLAVAQGVEIV